MGVLAPTDVRRVGIQAVTSRRMRRPTPCAPSRDPHPYCSAHSSLPGAWGLQPTRGAKRGGSPPPPNFCPIPRTSMHLDTFPQHRVPPHISALRYHPRHPVHPPSCPPPAAALRTPAPLFPPPHISAPGHRPLSIAGSPPCAAGTPTSLLRSHIPGHTQRPPRVLSRDGASARSDRRLDPGQGLACEQDRHPHPQPQACGETERNPVRFAGAGRGVGVARFPEIPELTRPTPSFPRSPSSGALRMLKQRSKLQWGRITAGAQVLWVGSSLLPVSEGADTAGRLREAASPHPLQAPPGPLPAAPGYHPGPDTPSQGLSPEWLLSLGLRPEGLTWEGNQSP